MTIKNDKLGRIPQTGDKIVHCLSSNGSTDLIISEILGFTKEGYPRIKSRWADYQWCKRKTSPVKAQFVIL